ncbi:MAG: zinc metallopeptidase [Pseudomonadota bacterium]
MVFTILLILALLALVALPGLWVKHVLKKYSAPEDRYRDKGTGAELARHLLDRFELQDVAVEVTPAGDHYDPNAKAVRLTEEKYSGCSLTAITVAAHEVGHAIQDARRETLFRNRQRLAQLAIAGQRFGSLFMLAAPVAMVLTRAPSLSLLFLVVAVGSMLLGTLVHLATLPVEFDASFNKALPLLESGEYLYAEDLPHAHKILKAAALTYVAASLASLLNLGRWLAVLRR